MPTTTFHIPKNRRHVSAARQRIRKTLADWGVDGELADSVAVSANELVTNAVAHCRVTLARIEVTLRADDTDLVLEVSDPDRDRLPHLRTAGPEDEGGRGLVLVTRLADEWGHRQQPYAKCVWARFSLAQEAARVPADV
ncbi:putative anti-sigma regulatory factor, serine/threonine protein kinase [Actinobacteria bacterium OK074]|nr:putative anti-sigma regulatory factor, serine/threonine protein kinase [Actinobacteria bacterium OK074]